MNDERVRLLHGPAPGQRPGRSGLVTVRVHAPSGVADVLARAREVLTHVLDPTQGASGESPEAPCAVVVRPSVRARTHGNGARTVAGVVADPRPRGQGRGRTRTGVDAPRVAVVDGAGGTHVVVVGCAAHLGVRRHDRGRGGGLADRSRRP